MKIVSLTPSLVFLCSLSLNATLSYQQEFTLSSFTSNEECRERVQQFQQAAEGDPDLKVVDIQYSQEPFHDNGIIYHATVKCHVAHEDIDIARIAKKMATNNPNLHLP